MKARLHLLALFFLIPGLPAFCQTKWIAHKSHSGRAEAFQLQGSDNFGLAPTARLDSVIRETDSTCVLVYSRTGIRSRERVVNHPEFGRIHTHAQLDSVRALYPRTVFVGFGHLPRRGQKPKPNSFGPAVPGGSGGGPGVGGLAAALALSMTALGYFLWRHRLKNLPAKA